MNRRAAAIAELEARIGHVFHDRELLERALTHASVGEGATKVRHYERLEFLGDRVLNLLAAERLMSLPAPTSPATLAWARPCGCRPAPPRSGPGTPTGCWATPAKP